MPAPGAALDNLSRDMRVGCGRPHLARNAAKTAHYGNRILQKIPSSHLRFPLSRSRMLRGWWRSFKMSHYPTLFGWTHRSELCYITP